MEIYFERQCGAMTNQSWILTTYPVAKDVEVLRGEYLN